MQTFIQQLVNEVIKRHAGQLQGLCVVFPTRRAGLFFQKELAATISTPIWSPAVFSIQDYLLKLAGQNIPDDLTLLFELYKSYKEYFPSEDFARFYPWGELMLKDFDDIDKYMINADKVFETVTDLQQIDRDFAMEEEDLERLRGFWKIFFDSDPSLLKNEFINTWKFLGRIYSSFRSKLEAKNIAYEGMAYRRLAGEISVSALKTPEEFSHTIFAGFYALSPSEQSIIQYLIDSGKASSFWDADAYYADDPAQEAGRFFRKNPLTNNNFSWKQEHFKNIKKEIEFAGVPLLVGQAKYAGNILNSLMQGDNFISEKTALVLPDEKLLFPVLYSLPENLTDINVTMGYPLNQTPLFNLFDLLMILQRNARVSIEGELSYYFRDVLNILNHPYIRLVDDRQIKNWLASLDQNYIRLPISKLTSEKENTIFRDIFVRLTSVKQAFGWYRKILRLILEGMKEQNFRFHRLESEFVYHFYTHLTRLEDLMKESEIVPDLETFWKIFREIISSVKIPFTGEPLKGLQVMGFLETRVLDFDNVIILSVNEDVLPAAGNKPSFIPFNIRKAFGLPTYEEQHAVYAFHFYRLLQRAGNIFLVHNTETKSLSTGERSRFLLQMEFELQRRYPESIHIVHKVISTKVNKETIDDLIIHKSAPVMKELSKYITDGKQNPSSALSASGLIAYIACPLRFYFRYVAGLAEQEEPEENMESATFGRVLHKTMQHLYTDIHEINNDSISKLKLKINDNVDRAIHEEFVNLNQLEGKNILLRNVIRELIRKILESEKLYIPFRILQLEKDVSNIFAIDQNRFVKLKGIIDRVDEKDGVIRIIDYKTGKIGKKRPDSLSDYFGDPAFKEQFQAMYYAYLTRSKMPGKKIISGLFAMRDMSDGIWFLNNNEPFSEEQFEEFEILLNKLLNEIFSKEIPFTQTVDEDRCKYCAYQSLCNRN